MRSLLLVAALTWSGCEDDTRVPAPIPREKFLASFADMVCQVSTRCCAPEARQPSPTCASDLVALYTSNPGTTKLDAPSLTYDAKAAGACIAAIQGVRGLCYLLPAESASVRDACAGVFHGLPTTGPACQPIGADSLFTQCFEDGSICNPTTGQCEPLPTTTQSCAYQCATGTFCDEGICKPLRSQREPCSTPLSCDSYTCTSFVCVGEPAQTGTSVVTLLPTACLSDLASAHFRSPKDPCPTPPSTSC